MDDQILIGLLEKLSKSFDSLKEFKEAGVSSEFSTGFITCLIQEVEAFAALTNKGWLDERQKQIIIAKMQEIANKNTGNTEQACLSAFFNLKLIVRPAVKS